MFAATFSVLGVAIWGLTKLETKFESSWFLPSDSYIMKWEQASAQYFAEAGERVTVYITDVNYTTDMAKIGQLAANLENSHSVVSSIRTFYPQFYHFVQDFYGISINSSKP